jgi:NADPH:quinone reductase-like Zn-dependent oxidoreductase
MTQDPANSAFQLYTVVTEALVAEIPDSLELKRAVVLPLAVSTACAGLYRKDYLSLPLPSVSEAKKTGQTILIWGGASSVGATAIQLAVASGLNVISTASVANHEFVKSLGADAVFDYRSPTVVDEIAKAVTNTEFVGVYDAIGENKLCSYFCACRPSGQAGEYCQRPALRAADSTIRSEIRSVKSSPNMTTSGLASNLW